MASKLVICVLLFAVLGCSFAKIKIKGKGIHSKIKKGYKAKPIPEVLAPVRPCDGVSCGAGRECIVTEENEPSCQCVEVCDESVEHIICGSDGITYPNKCELHRAACLRESKITQVKVGPCTVAPTVSHERPAAPAVCNPEDRNILQKQLVELVKSREVADGWILSGKSYHDIIDDFFTLFDESGDDILDSTEFMHFVEHNETVRNSTSTSTSQFMRCVDTLLMEADIDSDGILNKKEFETALSQEFEPGTRMCELESEQYPEGYEVQNKCNECVCASGNWLCTANACDGDMVAGSNLQEEYNTADENGMNQKEWTAMLKKLAKVTPEQFPTNVKDLKHLTQQIKSALPRVNPIEQFDEMMGGEEFDQMELVAEEVAMDMEQEAATQIKEDPLPAVPAVIDAIPIAPIDEGAVPPLVEEPPRVLDRIRAGGKKAPRKNKGRGKGKHGKKGKKAGRGKN